jgi:Zn-dependent M28 family amino/carboxypeptidase
MNTTADAPGANDDGSGVAAMMELAKNQQTSYPCTIVCCVTGEEQGLYGQHFSRNAKTEKWNIVAMLNNDMIGNSLSSGTRLSNNTKGTLLVRQFHLETEDEARCASNHSDNDSPSRQLALYQTATEQYVPQLEVELVYRNDRLRGGDHTPFSQNGLLHCM